MISKPNFKKAEQAAYTLLKQNNITAFPVKVKKISKTFKNLKIKSYTWFAKKNNMSIEEVSSFAGSEEGCCYYQKNNHKYLILYNDQIATLGRIRWTIAHELGHYILKHNEQSDKTIMSRNSLSKGEYSIFEKEADCFARSLLAPISVLHGLKKFNARDLSEWCHLSMGAAVNVLKFFNKGIELGQAFDPTDNLVKLFHDYINAKNHECFCNNCKHFFVSSNAKFCPICGLKKLVSRGSVTVIYESYELDNDGRPHRCPQCDNEEIELTDEYCKICGALLVNKCTNIIRYEQNGFGVDPVICSTPAHGNARFCTTCGGRTTYLEQGFLSLWNEEYRSTRKTEFRTELEIINEELEQEVEEEFEEERAQRFRDVQRFINNVEI